jgi:hypothetical protein
MCVAVQRAVDSGEFASAETESAKIECGRLRHDWQKPDFSRLLNVMQQPPKPEPDRFDVLEEQFKNLKTNSIKLRNNLRSRTRARVLVELPQ